MSEMKNIPDAGQSWLEAEKMLDKHFSRKRIISWLLILLVPAILGIGAYMYFSNLSFNNGNNVADNSNTANDKISENKSVKDYSSIPATSTPSPVASVNSNLNSQNKIPVSSSPVTTVSNNNKSSLSNNVNNSSNKFNDRNNNYNSDFNKKVEKNNPNNKKEIAVGSAVVASGTNSNSLNPNTDSQEEQDVAVASHQEVENRNDVYAMALLNPELPVQNKELFLATNLPGKPTVSHSSSHVSIQASVYAGANYISKTLSTTNDWDSYIQKRKSQEENIITPALGISLSAGMKNLSVSLGAEYSVYGEKTNYNPYSLQNTIVENGNWNLYTVNYIDTDTAYVIGNQYLLSSQRSRIDSSFNSSADTIQENKYDSYIAEKNGVNHITYIEMPIMVSYNLVSGRTGIGISGGISPGWLTKRSGYYLKTDGNGIESLEEIEGFRKFVMNGRVGLDLYYRMNSRMCLTLRPQMKANLNSIFEDSYGVKQKYTSTGILFGVSWILN